MFERFTAGARQAVQAAAEEASSGRGDPRLGTEHLLYGVAAVGDAVTTQFGLTPRLIHDELAAWDLDALGAVGLEPAPEVVEAAPPRRPWRRWLPRRHVPLTQGAKEALKRSLRICLAEGHRSIGTSHVLAAVALGGPRDPAVRLLYRLGIDPGELDAAIRRYWQAA